MSVDKVRHESWEEYNNVTKPAHYVCGVTYEPKDVIRDWGLNFNLGNVVKYIVRYGKKGDSAGEFLEDLKKARQYLTFEIEALEEERSVPQRMSTKNLASDGHPYEKPREVIC